MYQKICGSQFLTASLKIPQLSSKVTMNKDTTTLYYLVTNISNNDQHPLIPTCMKVILKLIVPPRLLNNTRMQLSLLKVGESSSERYSSFVIPTCHSTNNTSTNLSTTSLSRLTSKQQHASSSPRLQTP